MTKRRKAMTANEFFIRNVGYTTREYCESKGIIDKTQIKKIQWRINKYVHTHTKEEATDELIRLVGLSEVRKIGGTLTNTQDNIRTRKQLLKQSEWMEHGQPTFLNRPNTLPKIEEIHGANAPARLHTAYRSLKQYAEAIENLKTIQNQIHKLEEELQEAQKQVEKWSANTATLLRDI